MRLFLKRVLFYSAVVIFSACHQTRIVPAHFPRVGQMRVGGTDRSLSYLAGYFEGASVHADCQEGLETIRISRGIADTIVQVPVGGVISTRRVEVHCVIPHLDQDALQRGGPVTLKGIYFFPGEARLHDDSHTVLDELVAYLRAHPGTMILLVNHTDLSVPFPHNEVLSLARSAAVRDALVKRGIDAKRIAISGRGAQAPVIWGVDGVASLVNNRTEAIAWNGFFAPGVSTGQAQNAQLPSTGAPASGEAEITLLDGRILRGKVVNQAGDQIQAIIDGKVVILRKNQISMIRYGQVGP